jgi:ABC-type transport system involved in multi-copper enzyme maturation permease subunit
MGLSPFAILVLERDPLQWSDLGGMTAEWAQNAGGFAFFALAIYLVVRIIPGGLPTSESGRRSPVVYFAFVGFVISTLLFGVARGINVYEYVNAPPPDPRSKLEEYTRTDKLPTPVAKPQSGPGWWADALLTAGGAVALVGFGVPFIRDLSRLRFRRIGAIARLSFKEAVRRRVVWAPVVILLVFLFPPKWFFPLKPEDEVSTYVSVIFWAMTPIMLLIASLLAAFAIPTDMRNQTIHTVVTKPVERFEIVLGRIAGYVGLVTVILVALSGISLVLLWASDPSEEAQFESYKARVPVYGGLEFRKVHPQGSEITTAESVGREWEYRGYIPGASPYRAIWKFNNASDLRALTARTDAVPCEFSFDIFRTTKGDENKGVTCTFQFIARKWGDPYRQDARRAQAYQAARSGLHPYVKPTDAKAWAQVNKVAEDFGYYEYPSKEIVDFHTFNIDVPTGLIRAALEEPKDRPAGTTDQPRLLVIVKCESSTQFLGAAKGDLYLLAGDEPFWLNFLKGVFGLWLRLVLVTSVAVACSTYLSGVIAWLVVGFLYAGGLCQEFIAKLAAGVSVGGGPLESAVRLATNANITTQLPDSAGKSIAIQGDVVFSWILRRVLDILPDVDRWSWANYVASGFSIPWAEIVINSLVLAGYLLLVGVIGYYLMKSREVAA